jgi:hypothetical protein
MIDPEQTVSKEQDITDTTIQQLAQVAHEGVQSSTSKPGDWVEILDYCSYWGLDVPGLPIQGTP